MFSLFSIPEALMAVTTFSAVSFRPATALSTAMPSVSTTKRQALTCADSSLKQPRVRWKTQKKAQKTAQKIAKSIK